MPARFVELEHVRTRAIPPFVLLVLLSSCSDQAPMSPTAEAPGSTPVIEAVAAGKISIKVAHTAQLSSDGNVIVIGVRTVCPSGYLRQEEGQLEITQGFASGGGSVGLGCTGRWQSQNVRVEAFGTPFRPGRARVQVTFAAVDPNDPSGEGIKSSVDQTVKLR